MTEFTIRTAQMEDLPVILAIYAHARDFMREHDNPRQWNTTWPPKELLMEDIALNRLHVCEYEGRVVAVFMYIQGVDIDPTYRNIEDGGWFDDSEYGAVHRLASDGTVKGVGSACLSWAYEQCHHLRVDTHGDNYVMQNGLLKNGFTRCGTIYVVEDNDPRIAYEKSPVTLASKQKAYFHLPGLFEFYELYRAFLPIYRDCPEYFYDYAAIGSIYGAPADCLWGGGRVGYGDNTPREVLDLVREYGITPRLTFSNSLLTEEHLKDRRCNELCSLFADGAAGIIVHSDLLLNYLRETYPGLHFISSTTKVLTDFADLKKELGREEFSYVVPDFRLNKAFDGLNSLPQQLKDKVEFLCNECCAVSCTDRKVCYENVSRKNLGEDCPDHVCRQPEGKEGYRFSKAMENPTFIGNEDITGVYLPMGFSNFKIEGRSLGSAVVFEMLLNYLVKPEYHLILRERIYLDSMLDLF